MSCQSDKRLQCGPALLSLIFLVAMEVVVVSSFSAATVAFVTISCSPGWPKTPVVVRDNLDSDPSPTFQNDGIIDRDCACIVCLFCLFKWSWGFNLGFPVARHSGPGAHPPSSPFPVLSCHLTPMLLRLFEYHCLECHPSKNSSLSRGV